MLLINAEQNVYLRVPERLLNMPDFYIKKLRFISVDQKEKLAFFVPEHIKSNTDKKAYKCGYLYDIYKILHPKMKRKEIITEIIDKYDLFMEHRSFYDSLKVYEEKKHIFVK